MCRNTKAILVSSSSITAYIIQNLSQTFASKASIQDSFYKSCNLSLFSLVSLGASGVFYAPLFEHPDNLLNLAHLGDVLWNFASLILYVKAW